jgi:hypothetical protein
MNDLETQKRLLIAESELNRAYLVQDISALSFELKSLADKATSIGTLTSSAVGLVTNLVILRQGKIQNPQEKSSWVQTTLNGITLVSKIWSLWNPSGQRR